MKKVFSVLSLAVLAFVWFVGCSNNLAEIDSSAEYGSLCVESISSRSLDVSSIKSATVSVVSDDINTLISETVDNIEDGTGSIKIDKIPVGINRIVKVQGKDSNGNEIADALIMAV